MERVVRGAMRARGRVLAVTLALLVVLAWFARELTLDALPDVTTNQVLVLTRAPGLTPEEVERLISRPVEAALGGAPGLVQQRSLSRFGISAVTAVFGDDVDPYRARQAVQERLQRVTATLPEGAEAPELGPLSGGLGEVYQVALRSPTRTQAELLELATLRVEPLMRAIPGVVEVNPWGGAERSLDVTARPADLARLHLTLGELRDAVTRAVGSAPGHSLAAGAGQVLLRGMSRPRTPEALGECLVRQRPGEAPVRVRDVAEVSWGMLPRIGAATADGGGEVLYLMVQMLRDANALELTEAIHAQVPAMRAALPADVSWTVVYDRSELVNRTLRTVGKSLAEGGALVALVLFAMLGSLRAGLIVAAVIPLSMLCAAAAMARLGVPGNLMSLGALDFGLLVDGAVVMVEGLFHALHHRGGKAAELEAAAANVARPVFFGVLVIVLVYVPVLSLTGVDGKMFRPMALTVILALLSSLALALTAVPAAASWLLRPEHVPARDPWLVRLSTRAYAPALRAALTHPGAVITLAVLALAVGAGAFARLGSSFVPQLDEGDLVVQSTRAPDISLESAVDDAARMERVLRGFPEVRGVVSRIGSPAVATDVMGLEQADVFVRLAPREQWRPGVDREALAAQMGRALAARDPGNEVAFTQPIQMRFNELVGGSVTDVDVSVYGEDLAALRETAEGVVRALRGVRGAVDARVLAPPGVPLQEVIPRAAVAARYGWSPADVLDAVRALRVGLPAGVTWDGAVRVPLRVMLPTRAGAFGTASTMLPTAQGELVPLGDVAEVRERETPGLLSRQGAQRRLVVGFNVRGAELGDVVREAQARVLREVPRVDGVRLVWGGQYESMQDARRRLGVVVPVTLLAVLGVLLWTFRRAGPALLILLNVPFAGVGGALLLAARGISLSMPAAVGFIALSGIAVLNGVVWMGRTLQRRESGQSWSDAARDASMDRLRPVLMTAMVALLGFVPMAVATGAGAEVQRPLATVVVGGIPTSTALTLLVLPALVRWWDRRRARTTGA